MQHNELTMPSADGNPLPGRQIMLLARAGRTLVVQSFDMAELTDEESRYFAATSQIFVDWIEELERIGPGRADVQAVAKGAAMSQLRAALMRAFVSQRPSSAEEFRAHAQSEALALLKRLHQVLFGDAYALGDSEEGGFLEMVAILGQAIREGRVVYRECAKRRVDGQVAATEARADVRFQESIARILAGVQVPSVHREARR